MQKEKLTLQHIQKDVRSSIKEHCLFTVLFSLLLVALLATFIAGFWLSPADYIDELPMVLIAAVVLSWRIGYHVHHIVMRSATATLPRRIVKDTLINAEYIDRFAFSIFPRRYRFHFARCGKYIVPQKNYVWSDAFAMEDRGVFNYAVPGDAFYLVLSKPGSGKVLYAYNAKMFDWTP